MTSFTRPSASNESAVHRPAADAQGNNRDQRRELAAEDDDAAEQLQKELELFAQDEDEESALMITDYAGPQQP